MVCFNVVGNVGVFSERLVVCVCFHYPLLPPPPTFLLLLLWVVGVGKLHLLLFFFRLFHLKSLVDQAPLPTTPTPHPRFQFEKQLCSIIFIVIISIHLIRIVHLKVAAVQKIKRMEKLFSPSHASSLYHALHNHYNFDLSWSHHKHQCHYDWRLINLWTLYINIYIIAVSYNWAMAP